MEIKDEVWGRPLFYYINPGYPQWYTNYSDVETSSSGENDSENEGEEDEEKVDISDESEWHHK